MIPEQIEHIDKKILLNDIRIWKILLELYIKIHETGDFKCHECGKSKSCDVHSPLKEIIRRMNEVINNEEYQRMS